MRVILIDSIKHIANVLSGAERPFSHLIKGRLFWETNECLNQQIKYDKMPLKNCSFRSAIHSLLFTVQQSCELNFHVHFEIPYEPFTNILFTISVLCTCNGLHEHMMHGCRAAFRTKERERETERRKKAWKQEKSSPKMRRVMGSDLDTMPLKDDV